MLELKKFIVAIKMLFLIAFFYVINMSLTVVFTIAEFYMQGNSGPLNFANVTSSPEKWAMIATVLITLGFIELHATANPSKIYYDEEKLYIRTAFRTLAYELNHCGCYENKFFFSTYYSIEVSSKKLKKKKFDISNMSYKGYHTFFEDLNIAIKYF